MKLRNPAVVGTTTLLFTLAGAALSTGAQAAGTTFVPCGNAAGLVAAVNSANSGGPSTIVLAPGCTYTLTSVADSVGGSGNNGLPHITSHLSIVGYNSTIARSASAPSFRIAEVDPGAGLSLNSITLTGGSAPFGGGFFNQGTTTLSSSSVTNNVASRGGGGGYDLNGTTTFNSSSLTHNSSSIGGGGLQNENASTTFNRSTISNNTAVGGGGGLANASGSITLNYSSVTGNHASTGGGVYWAGGSVVLLASNVSGNTPDNCAPPNSVPGCIG